MKNIRALILRLVVNVIMMLTGYGMSCGICYMFFGTVGNFKFWFAFAFVILFVAVAMDDVHAFVNAQNKKRR